MSSTEAASTVPLRVTRGPGAGADAPFFLGMAAGVYAAHGLQIEQIPLGGVDEAARAVAEGRVDISTMPGASLANVNLAGGDLAFVLSFVGRCIFGVIAARGVRSPRQLRGQRVGINRGGGDHLVLAMAFDEWGMDLERDVQIVEGMARDTMWEALTRSELQAFASTPPLNVHAEVEGYPVLLNFEQRLIPFQLGGLAVRRGFVAAHPEPIARFLAAEVESIKRFRADPALGQYYTCRYLNNAETSRRTYEVFRRQQTPTLEPTVESMAGVLRELTKVRPEAARLKAEDMVEPRFVNDLRAAGALPLSQ